jgi:TonB family protein
MFAPLQNRRSPYAIGVSLALHILAIAMLVYAVRPLWLKPTAMGGTAGKANLSKLVYIGQQEIQKKAPPPLPRKPLLTLDQKRNVPKETPEKSPEVADNLGPILKISAGVPSFHDIRIALPLTTPDPEIKRSDLPQGFVGDAIVEVTIDREGKVVQTKITQALGYGLDSRVVTALMNWRFKPAYYDGAPIASLQEIHLHYPDNALDR